MRSENLRSAFTAISMDQDHAKSGREGHNWRDGCSGGCDGDNQMETDWDAPRGEEKNDGNQSTPNKEAT